MNTGWNKHFSSTTEGMVGDLAGRYNNSSNPYTIAGTKRKQNHQYKESYKLNVRKIMTIVSIHIVVTNKHFNSINWTFKEIWTE